MGHALVAHYSENLDPVHRITIIPRGTAALGLTMTRPLEDRFLTTEPELKDTLAYAMGGRVAEEIVLRRDLHRRAERPRAGDPDRARDGDAVRHEREGRPPLARPGRPERDLRRPQDLRRHRRADRRRGHAPVARGPRPRRTHPPAAPRPARPPLCAAPRHRDDRRRGPRGVHGRHEADPRLRAAARARGSEGTRVSGGCGRRRHGGA